MAAPTETNLAATGTDERKLNTTDKRIPILLVCDMQTRFRAGIPNFDHVAATTAKMIRAASILNFRVIASEQKPEVFGLSVPDLELASLKDGLFLGAFAKTRFGMLIPEVSAVLEKQALPKLVDGARQPNRTPIVLMGIEAHICIQQTAIELVELGYEVHVLADGVTSIHHKGEVSVALDRMRQAGVYVTTSESFLFTYMGDANRPEFKEFARLIKDAKPVTTSTLAALFGPEASPQ